MTTPSAKLVVDEITDITTFLVEQGFADDQNWPTMTTAGSDVTISFPNPQHAAMLRDISYRDLYQSQRRGRSFNVLMLDGALIQIDYEFTGEAINRSRLAFLPSPDLEAFQNDPELYELDNMYADVISRQIVTVPIRFDFDTRSAVSENILHPKAHVTLGQYKNCRIATAAPVTPGVFIGFILRSFYNTAIRAISGSAPCFSHRWSQTITQGEAALLHIAVP